MSSLSDRLKLIINTAADPFETSDLTANSNILDDHPGTFICTSLTRPTWGAAQDGMSIFETDTNLIWHWSGVAWERLIPKGWVATTQITVDVGTSSTTYQTAITNTVSVVAGDRRHLIIAAAPRVYSTLGLTQLALFRDATLLVEWFSQGGTGPLAPDQPRENFPTIVDQPTAGTRVYTLKYRAVAGIGGTSTVAANATNPASLSVVEV